MSKLKCQVKSKCLNDKTYPGHLSAEATGNRVTESDANFSFIWSFDIQYGRHKNIVLVSNTNLLIRC